MLSELFKRMARFTHQLLLCQRGDNLGEGAAAGGQSEGSQEGDQGDGNQGGGQGQEGSGEGNQGGEGGESEGEGGEGSQGEGQAGGSQAGEEGGEGQFGGFNTVEELVEAFNNQGAEFTTLKGKQTATETNLATTRNALKGANLVMDQDGHITMQKKADARQPKFTDQHANLFEKPVLDAMRLLFQDILDDQQDKTNARTTQEQQFFNERQEAVGLMFGYFPQLKHPDIGGGEDFNQNFHDAAIALYKSNYSHLPNGELVAALKVAQTLKISAKAIVAAKKAGFKQAQSQRKVMGPAGQQQQGGAKGGFKKLSQAEFLKLDPDAREKYKKDELDSKK